MENCTGKKIKISLKHIGEYIEFGHIIRERIFQNSQKIFLIYYKNYS